MNEEREYTIVDHLIVNGNVVFVGDYFTLLKAFINSNSWLTRKTNKREIVYSRRFLAVELVRVSNMSYESVGKLLGGFDHATITHHHRQHKSLTETNDKLYKFICSDVKEKINEFRKVFKGDF